MKLLTLIAFTALAMGAAFAADPVPAGPLKDARAAAEKGDFPTALKILRADAAKGGADSANALGELLLTGRSGPPEPAEAARFFQAAADASHPLAMMNLARLLEQGAPGVAKDGEKAKFLVRAAAEAGLATAQSWLGEMLDAEAVRADDAHGFAEAREWYEKAAAQNLPAAFLALGRMHDRGVGGFEKNPRKGMELTLQAAKAGSIVAMNEMGVRYQHGMGIAQDNVAAIGWFSLAAQYHLAAAHVNLGKCYEDGNGVLQDYDRAGAQYAAAAKQDFPIGEFLLGQLFEKGHGTAVDLVKAYTLYVRAARSQLPAAVERRDALKAQLSSTQLADAEKLLAKAKLESDAAAAGNPKQ